MDCLTDMPNIGPIAADALERVGIKTPEQLRQVGAQEAWLRIRTQVDPGACLHLLQGLEAAVENIPKKLLTAEKRAELNAFFKNY